MARELNPCLGARACRRCNQLSHAGIYSYTINGLMVTSDGPRSAARQIRLFVTATSLAFFPPPPIRRHHPSATTTHPPPPTTTTSPSTTADDDNRHPLSTPPRESPTSPTIAHDRPRRQPSAVETPPPPPTTTRARVRQTQVSKTNPHTLPLSLAEHQTDRARLPRHWR